MRFTRDQRLHVKGVLSDEELEETRTEKRLAEAALLRAQENLQLAQLENERALAALELRSVRSPIDGFVIERYLSPGELVTRQQHSKIVKIAQIDVLRVEVLLPAPWFGRISIGDKATVRPEFVSPDSYEADVVTVDRVIDAASGTFRVRLEMPNEGHELPAGIRCRVRLQASD